MIPYELIIPSASRPHLLEPTLRTLLQYVDQPPQRILVHDDAVFPGQVAAVQRIVEGLSQQIGVSNHLGFDAVPIGHGPALKWLLDHVRTEYVLYSQDDFETLRPLPIQQALTIMHQHGLHQIRFNKRATMEFKETAQGRWYKKEKHFAHSPIDDACIIQPLTVSDHWYFQTGLWRVSVIKPIVDWFMTNSYEWPWFHEGCEDKINRAMDLVYPPAFTIILSDGAPWHQTDPDVRAQYQRTFIWGPIGEDRYIIHLGGDPKDFALRRPRQELGGGTMNELRQEDSHGT